MNLNQNNILRFPVSDGYLLRKQFPLFTGDMMANILTQKRANLIKTHSYFLKMRSCSLFLSIFIILQTSCTVKSADPIAKISGPQFRQPGQLLILNTTGTVGQDPKITCNPENNDYQLVKLTDGSTGIFFSTIRPGTYVFALGVNQDNKTAITTYQVLIADAPNPNPPPGPTPPVPPGPTPPVPPPVPPSPDTSPYYKQLQEAFSKDKGTTQDAKQLAAFYRQVALKYLPDEKVTNFSQVLTSMRQGIDQYIPKTSLTNTRQAIADIFKTKYPDKYPDLNAQTRSELTTIFNNIALALDQVK